MSRVVACLKCMKQFVHAFFPEKVFADEVPKCTADGCGKLVKPGQFDTSAICHELTRN